MRKSIFFKNFIVTILMFAICFVVFGFTMLMMGRAFLVREKQSSMYAVADEVKAFSEAVYDQGGLKSLEMRMSLAVIAQSNDSHILVCDENGVIVSCSDNSLSSQYINEQLSDTIMGKLREDGSYEAMTNLDGVYDGARYVVGETLQGRNGRTVGYVLVSYETSGFFGSWGGFAMIFVLVAVVVLLLAILFEYYNSRRLSRPLYEMAEAARRFAQEDYSARISGYDEEDEIGMLAESFNAMAEGLEQNEARRQEFVANVSHELRTPMTTISGFADGILDGTIPQSEERKYLEIISSETKRLSRLVRSMLDMSRLRSGDPALREKTFDLSEMMVETVLNFVDRVEAKHLDMDLSMPEDALFVHGDVDALTRVLYNLIDNAIKFADEGTVLTVSLWKEGKKAYVSVQDIGEELPQEELPRIFDRFHKADRSRSQDRDGVGLGLYMVRQIIADHDQDIFVTSEEGTTVFTFTLALADPDEITKH